MERLVKARFCLVDGMVSRQVGASALTAQWLEASEVVVAGVGGACPGLVVAGRLLGGTTRRVSGDRLAATLIFAG
jgi:hypothetical protein